MSKQIHPKKIQKDILEELASHGGAASVSVIVDGLMETGEYHSDSKDLLWFHIKRLASSGVIVLESKYVTLPEGLNAVVRLTVKGEEQLRPFVEKLSQEIFSAPGIARVVYLLIGAVLGALASRMI